MQRIQLHLPQFWRKLPTVSDKIYRSMAITQSSQLKFDSSNMLWNVSPLGKVMSIFEALMDGVDWSRTVFHMEQPITRCTTWTVGAQYIYLDLRCLVNRKLSRSLIFKHTHWCNSSDCCLSSIIFDRYLDSLLMPQDNSICGVICSAYSLDRWCPY